MSGYTQPGQRGEAASAGSRSISSPWEGPVSPDRSPHAAAFAAPAVLWYSTLHLGSALTRSPALVLPGAAIFLWSTGAVNSFSNFSTLKTTFIWTLKTHLSLTYCSFEMPCDNHREGKQLKTSKFSCILFTGHTIHFIYKWLKITKISKLKHNSLIILN